MRASPYTDSPRRRRRPRSAAAVLLPIALLAAAAGCTGSPSGGVSAEAPAAGPGAGDAAQERPEGAAAPEQAPGSDQLGDVPLAERDLVHTADLAVEVENVEKAAEEAVDWTESAGGYVAAENVQTAEGGPPHASLTLHVPQKRYEDALHELAALGDRSSLDRRVEDVTEEVADVDSRVESAEASLDRLRDLLSEAETVEDVLAVEEQISTRQEDLEALQARQEALAQQTSYGTVHLDLAPPETYVQEPEGDSIGFLGGLQRGWHALVAVGSAVAVAVGWLLPFLAVAALIAVPAWLAWRRRSAAGQAARQPVAAGSGAPAEGAEGASPADSGTARGSGPESSAAAAEDSAEGGDGSTSGGGTG
ncbi:DUF4349 domain-containing protein [Streptomonospora sp. PA3]|uniref:DUF4349 domain-containing protein n=1 Tax=Streptomonospora sp. PA3 TaxID=2607326 RepID=UPI0012DE44CB|nr:DUF4349 domain-containing protein [Streptomonospora sp. PA3]MUL43493.1 DUF4349 domain-containing protein [Streptomonospora sp. PA3]